MRTLLALSEQRYAFETPRAYSIYRVFELGPQPKVLQTSRKHG
jgi:hypothetical protein